MSVELQRAQAFPLKNGIYMVKPTQSFFNKACRVMRLGLFLAYGQNFISSPEPRLVPPVDVSDYLSSFDKKFFNQILRQCQLFCQNLLVRDTADDFINVTLWLSASTALAIDNDFHIGDVVQIRNPKVELKNPASHHDRSVAF